MKKRFDRSGTARRKAVTAIAALTMALVLAVGGAYHPAALRSHPFSAGLYVGWRRPAGR